MKESTLAFDVNAKDPTQYTPGWFGTAVWYTNVAGVAGPYIGTQYAMREAIQIANDYASYKAKYATFTTASTGYKTTMTTYDTALTAETTRAADFMKAMFEPPVAIPQRPCPPEQPMSPMGPKLLVFDSAKASPTAWTAVSKTDGSAYLKYSTTHVTNDLFHTRVAYIAPASDTTPAAKVTANIGAVFGRLGEGTPTLNTDAGTTGFYWGVVDTAKTPTMIVSFLPEVMADTGLVAAANTATMSAKAIAWLDLNTLAAPAPPAANANPKAAGAAALTGSLLAASAVVAAALY